MYVDKIWLLILVLPVMSIVTFAIRVVKKDIISIGLKILIICEMFVLVYCIWSHKIIKSVICGLIILVAIIILIKIKSKTMLNKNDYLNIVNSYRDDNNLKYILYGFLIALCINFLLNIVIAINVRDMGVLQYIFGHTSFEGIKLFLTTIILGIAIKSIQSNRISKLNIIMLVSVIFVGFMVVTFASDFTDSQVWKNYGVKQQKISKNNLKNNRHTIKQNSEHK